MGIGCNGARAHLAWSAFLANPSRGLTSEFFAACADSRDGFYCPKVGDAVASGEASALVSSSCYFGPGVFLRPQAALCSSVLSVAWVASRMISPGAASIAADRVEPVAGALRSRALIRPRHARNTSCTARWRRRPGHTDENASVRHLLGFRWPAGIAQAPQALCRAARFYRRLFGKLKARTRASH